MYLPFVMLGYAGILCLIPVGCWLVSRAIPRLRGVRELAWAVAAAILSVILVGLRPWTSAFFSILLGNCALFTYFLLIYWTVAHILAQRARALPWLIGFCSAALLPFSYYAFIQPNIVARIEIAGGVTALVAIITATMLLRQRTHRLRPVAVALGCALLASAALYLGRSAGSVLHPPTHFVLGDWLQTAFTYGQMLTRVATCCGVLWLAVCIHKIELEQLAMSDSLTGLLNRRAFDSLLAREMSRCQATGNSLALVLLDIDQFKDINDTYGHCEGDAVLRQMGATLKDGVRPGDALARYGGEEFAILLQNSRCDEVAAIAERLRVEIEAMVVGAEGIRITASLGVANSSPAESPLEFLNRCDRALYRSKSRGRNCVSACAI